MVKNDCCCSRVIWVGALSTGGGGGGGGAYMELRLIRRYMYCAYTLGNPIPGHIMLAF